MWRYKSDVIESFFNNDKERKKVDRRKSDVIANMTLGVIDISADAKKVHFGTPRPSWHYADIFLGPPP